MKQQTFTTKNGTELPMIDLRGKPYLQVAHRLVWFREEKPDWSIETKMLEHDANHAIFHALIADQTGRQIATATGHETKLDFPDFIEKAETKAIGRALAMCGYGTQFAPDLDEGERLADAPVTQAKAYTLRGRTFEATKTASPNQKKFVADLAVQKLGAKIGDKADIIAKLNAKFPTYALTSSDDLSNVRANNIIETLQAAPDFTNEDGLGVIPTSFD